MWFKNIQLFKFIENFNMSVETLEEKLSELQFKPCGTTDFRTEGFYPPTGDDDAPLVHAANGFMMICLKSQEKMLPASVVNEHLNEKLDDIEAKEDRKVRKKEKDALKEEITHTLLPQAFTKSSYLYAIIDPKEGWFIVDTPSNKKAEGFVSSVRGALGSFKVELPNVQSVSMIMTDWLVSQKLPQDFSLQENCLLQDDKENGSIRCVKQDLFSDEIHSLVKGGREVIMLALCYKEELGFVLKDDFTLKGLKFLDNIQDMARDIYTETATERFDADFSIMTETLRHFINMLFTHFAAKSAKTSNTTEAKKSATTVA